MIAPEATLWALLDKHGVPFRQPAGALVATYVAQDGAQNIVWTDYFLDCVLPGVPIVPGASAFSFMWQEGSDPTLPPLQLSAHVRTARFSLLDLAVDRRADRNLAAILRVLCPLLGRGAETPAVNTKARVWHLGQARIEATCFPPRLNWQFGENQHHLVDPGAQHEATVKICPGWLPDLKPVQIDWLRNYVPLGQPFAPRDGSHFAPERWHRWPVGAGPIPRPGFGPSRDGGGFCTVVGDLVLAIPHENLREVVLDVATPARGCGGVDLVLTHAPAGLILHAPHRVMIMRAAYAPGALHREAEVLAHTLNLPLTVHSAPDE